MIKSLLQWLKTSDDRMIRFIIALVIIPIMIMISPSILFYFIKYAASVVTLVLATDEMTNQLWVKLLCLYILTGIVFYRGK